MPTSKIMMDFVVEYWTQIVFLVAFIFYIYNQIKALKNGMKALLHDRIVQKCEYHLEKGYITPSELDELDYLNEPYKGLKGNGTAKVLIHKAHQLPIKNIGGKIK